MSDSEQNTEQLNSEVSEMTSDIKIANKTTLPGGEYTLVSVDVDATGRRLIDEIVQIAAYTPNNQFSQYIMPIMNLNPAARQRHQIRVITVGFFRMLKSTQTYKVVKTKTEVCALRDFLDWLESVNSKSENSEGIILLYHEQRKFVPFMILEAMDKYELLPRFFKTVKAFSNGFSLSETKLGNTIKFFTLKQLSQVLLYDDSVGGDKSRNDFEGNAIVRARLAYKIIEHLVTKDCKEEISKDDLVKKMFELIADHAAPVNDEITALGDQNKCMDRQNSLRPIFVNYFKVTLYHRVKGVTFRRVLADYGYDLDQLHEIWTSKKKSGLVEVIEPIHELKTDDKTELIDLIDSHFDPEKQAILPIVKKHRTKRGQHQHKENLKPKSGEPLSPDSTNKDVHRIRNRRRRLSSNKQDTSPTKPTNKFSNPHPIMAPLPNIAVH